MGVLRMCISQTVKLCIMFLVLYVNMLFLFSRNYLEKVTSPGPITFCHNDIQEGNYKLGDIAFTSSCV